MGVALLGGGAWSRLRGWCLLGGGLLLWGTVGTQLGGALAVPAVDFSVRLVGEGLLGQVDREWGTVVGALEVPVAHGVLEEGDVLLGREEDLNGFPAHETLESQGGHGGRCEVVVGRLEGVLASCHLPDI